MAHMLSLPDEVRFIDLYGMPYYIYWENLSIGASFFLPTTATPAQVDKALTAAKKHLNFRFAVRARREFGRHGVRVWRIY